MGHLTGAGGFAFSGPRVRLLNVPLKYDGPCECAINKSRGSVHLVSGDVPPPGISGAPQIQRVKVRNRPSPPHSPLMTADNDKCFSSWAQVTLQRARVIIWRRDGKV